MPGPAPAAGVSPEPWDAATSVQIEITTHCNYECFYCAGRDMPQEHMRWETFLAIVEGIPPGRRAVSLQGEGEPTTHPRFWDMAAEVKRRGFVPYTITNGSCGEIGRIAAHFPSIGVSLDTLDPGEAERIGRYKLPRMLKNLERLLERVGPERIIVHTVDYGQPLQALRDFVKEKAFARHVVQPLQTKDDYAYRYRDRVPLRLYRTAHRCRFVEQPLMRYYDIAGKEMPCCYIKDAAKFVSTRDVRESLARGEVPPCCTGCREILRPAQLSAAGGENEVVAGGDR